MPFQSRHSEENGAWYAVGGILDPKAFGPELDALRAMFRRAFGRVRPQGGPQICLKTMGNGAFGLEKGSMSPCWSPFLNMDADISTWVSESPLRLGRRLGRQVFVRFSGVLRPFSCSRAASVCHESRQRPAAVASRLPAAL